jgi:four helix bundle suffix protein
MPDPRRSYSLIPLFHGPSHPQQDRLLHLGKPRLTGLAGLSDFMAKADLELAANAMLCAVNQAAYLLKRQLESQSREFTEKGGFTGRLYATRVLARAAQDNATAPA